MVGVIDHETHERHEKDELLQQPDPPKPVEQAFAVLEGKLVFPDPKHAPAAFPEFPIHLPIPFHVSRDLLSPELGVVLGPSLMLGAPVPEAAVHENGQFDLWENEVRLAQNFRASSPFVGPVIL